MENIKKEYFNHVMKLLKLLNNREVEVQLSDLDFILDDVICDKCPAKDKCDENKAPCREWDEEFNKNYKIKIKVTVNKR